MEKKLIIFDLDGTLLDSLEDIALSTNSVLKSFECEEYPVDSYKKFVGDGARELVKRALPDTFSTEQIDQALEMFKKIYSNKVNGNTKPFDGIYDMLESLQSQCDFAILSNKPHKFTLEYMDLFFNEYEFKVIHGQKDNVPKKPDPAGANFIMQTLGYEAKDVYYIGDTTTDMKTASNGNMTSIGVSWGYQDEQVLLDFGAQFLANKPSDIVNIITSQ